ncbi:hypothetical protein M758_12G147200 [Ceratodon purpureus]|nr:hypothetical protein M758_12G147200 [Ceratodon purpureus]
MATEGGEDGEGEGEEVIIPIELQPWSDFEFFYQKTKEGLPKVEEAGEDSTNEEKEKEKIEGETPNEEIVSWNEYTPHQLSIIFTNGPIELLHRGWARLERGITLSFDNDNPKLDKLNHWDPFELKDEGKRLYHSYSPVILDTKSGNFEVLAFFPPRHNRKQTQGCWYTMPSLAFLPIGIKRIIGGDGGLLICDGGMLWTGVLEESGELSPFTARPPLVLGGRPVPIEQEKWLREIYLPGQSIMLICNPITQEFMYLPPFHRTMTLNAKAACIRYLDFAQLRPPTPPPEEPSNAELDALDGASGSEGIEEIVQRASRRGTILEKKLSRKMSMSSGGSMMRRTSRHANLDDELDELDDMKKAKKTSRRRSSTYASEDVHLSEEVEKIIEGRFQRLWRLYFECFGRIPVVVPPPTRHYIVVVIGYQQEMKFDGYEDNRIVCCVYKSKEQDKWSYIRPIPCPTSLAMLTSLHNTDWMAAIEKEEPKYRAFVKSEYKIHADLMETPAIFFVSVVPEDDTALLACPVVLQPFGVKSPELIVALTRKPYWADRLILFQIEFEHDDFSENPRPTGRFLWISETPPCVYHNLFYTEKHTNKPFESSADGQRLGIYDMYTARWWIEDFHKFRPMRRKARPFQLMDISSWEPSFRQRVEYDSKYIGGRPDPVVEGEDGANTEEAVKK